MRHSMLLVVVLGALVQCVCVSAMDAMGTALEQDDAASLPRTTGAAAISTQSALAARRIASLAPVARGAELSEEQLAAIGVTAPPSQASSSTPAVVTKVGGVDVPVVATLSTASERLDERATLEPAAANVSIDHVEAHLQILQQLELSVAQSIEEMESGRYVKPTGDALRIRQELHALKVRCGVCVGL